MAVLDKETDPKTHQTSAKLGLGTLAQNSVRKVWATSESWACKNPSPPFHEITMSNVKLGEAYKWLQQSVVATTELCINLKEVRSS